MEYRVTCTDWTGQELIWGDGYGKWEATNQASELIDVSYLDITLRHGRRNEHAYRRTSVYQMDTEFGFGTLVETFEWKPEFRYFTNWRPAPRYAMHGPCTSAREETTA